MMAKHTFNSPKRNTLFNILPKKILKNWRIKARWTIEAVAKINYKEYLTLDIENEIKENKRH